GAATPEARRSRPDDPPSSAPRTTAVIDPAYRRTAWSASASPCPPPRATTLRSRSLSAPFSGGTVDVPVVNRGAMTETPEALPELLADHDAAMPPTCAPEPDRQLRLSFALSA